MNVLFLDTLMIDIVESPQYTTMKELCGDLIEMDVTMNNTEYKHKKSDSESRVTNEKPVKIPLEFEDALEVLLSVKPSKKDVKRNLNGQIEQVSDIIGSDELEQ